MRRAFLSLLLISAFGGSAGLFAQQKTAGKADRVDVIVATRRDHAVVFFRADSLAPLGSFVVNNLASNVSVSARGDHLFVAAAQTQNGNECCALFSLDLRDRTLCRQVFPALASTASTTRDEVYYQRGNTGIEGFETGSLAKLPTVRVPGVYHLLPSPDGKWLFGVTAFQGASLDIVSLADRRMVRRLPLTEHRSWDGAWVGKDFYLLSHNGKDGALWTIHPEETDKGPKFCKPADTCADRAVVLPDLGNGGKVVGLRVLSAGSVLFAYEPLGWWFKINRRAEQHTPFPGGILKIEPRAGKVLAHFSPQTDYAQVIAGTDGRSLYAIDAGMPDATAGVRLLKIDADTGEILATELLQRDVWHITAASVRRQYIPAGAAVPNACAAQH